MWQFLIVKIILIKQSKSPNCIKFFSAMTTSRDVTSLDQEVQARKSILFKINIQLFKPWITTTIPWTCFCTWNRSQIDSRIRWKFIVWNKVIFDLLLFYFMYRFIIIVLCNNAKVASALLIFYIAQVIVLRITSDKHCSISFFFLVQDI